MFAAWRALTITAAGCCAIFWAVEMSAYEPCPSMPAISARWRSNAARGD